MITKSRDKSYPSFFSNQDKRLPCTEDKEFQSSTNVLQAYWTIPTEKEHFLHDIHWAIEERAPVASKI
jgi:hypothetical protein